ncbi:MAG: GntR family transcriptional regulator [Pseudomonadota bacterium]
MASPEPQLGPPQSSAFERVKTALMTGGFHAGSRLKAEQVKTRFGLSASAAREILLRLTGEGLLVQEENRGFHVPEVSMRSLNDAMELRSLLECACVEGSIAHGDVEWEARLTAAHHKLAHVEQKMREATVLDPFIEIWTRTDSEFHETLASACPSTTLRAARLNAHERSRMHAISILPTYGFRERTVPEHADILASALARDTPRCQAAIRAHFHALGEDANLRGLA